LQILQGLEPPDSGKVNIGDTVIFGNYAQQGLEIKEDKRLIEYVKDIAEHFPLADGSYLSASQFLSLFLFPPEQQYTYISRLSGGEKRRLHLLSILFRNPNFLILDEPTNDLDLQTLSVLENFLSEFQGCMIIVSHDRYFMDRLVDHLFVFEGNGFIRDFPGNYTIYRVWAKEQEKLQEEQNNIRQKPASNNYTAVYSEPTAAKKKLTYKEKREFEILEKEIEALENEKRKVTEQLTDGSLPYAEVEKLSKRIGEITSQLEEKEMKWLEFSEFES
jgi:ABC transport system ATP-binding/permease protein